ncbi:MAG: imidazole glycerol phosphate synthase subunit HisH [Kiritimatiellia bacterium]
MTLGIIDYGMGNLGSVSNACSFLELPARIITAPEAMAQCQAIILPGVGAFGDCMAHLEDHGFVEPIKTWIAADHPFLGICLGLQALFESSEESPGIAGLGVLAGSVKKFRIDPSLKVPQIGWNRVAFRQPEHPFFKGVSSGTHFYFVHSYYVDARDEELVAGVTGYGLDYTSAVARGNLVAVQFHPEKSQQAGLALLKNFGAMAA